MSDEVNPGKPSLYVFGDSGTDEFVLRAHQAKERRVSFPSGALFDYEVLSKLVSDLYDVTPLVKETTKKDDDLVINALEPNAALISDYKGTSRISGYERSTRQKPALALTPMLADTARNGCGRTLLVAHHSGSDWSNATLDACDTFVSTLTGKKSAWPLATFPRVLVNLSSVLPTGALDEEKKVHFKSKLWRQLYEKREHVGIVMSMSTLRAESAVISRRLSIEHIVEDLCSDLHLFPSLNLLGSFSHIFVRVGMIAVVHLYHVPDSVSNNRFAGEVYFSPYADLGLHRDSEQEGGTLGRTALLIAALARGLAEVDRQTEWSPFLRRACMRALLAMKVMDDNGYRFETGMSGVDAIAHAVGETAEALKNTQPGNENINAFGWRSIPDHVLAPPQHAVQRERWHILDDVCLEAPVHRINIAMAMVVGGYRKVLNRTWNASPQTSDQVLSLLQRVEYWNPHDRAPDFVTLQDGYKPSMPQWPGAFPTTPIIGNLAKPFELNVPVMAFGKLDLVERDEIESLRSIANLLRLHRAQVQQTPPEKRVEKKPISVAVFGPPGSGKGFAVKQLASTVGKSTEIPVLEFNVAQFGGVSDLIVALEEVAKKLPVDVGDTVITPLVFFDEFDCALGSEELAWLKYFLGPMQDGTVKEKRIGPAIFVFAGGVYANFSRFDPRTDAAYDNLRDSEEYRQRLAKFVGQKGPDFISRLRGHVDILPINDLPGRPKHFIRRAMQLRSLLAMNQFVDKVTGVANIDDALVYAFLTVDRYHHGVRSMQAIVEMCSPLYGRLEISSLPSRRQLDMHVDAAEFIVRVHRGRERKRQEYQYRPD